MALPDIRVPPRTTLMRKRAGAASWRRGDIVPAAEAEPPERRGGNHYTPVTADMGRKTDSRFALKPLTGRPAKMPPYDSPAIVEGRTIYTSTVVAPSTQRILKSGANQAKIGGRVLKGRWKGMAIFCLTLEERKTCPTTCQMWRSCYGNGMHWSVRFKHGSELEAGLRAEVADLARKHPNGFVVRLHILGDFYSVDYVRIWAELLDAHPELNIFGYTARWRPDDPIGQAILKIAHAAWERFSIRFSNAPIDTCSTINVDLPGQAPADAIVCPEQIGQTESCANCGLCWDSNKRIAFIRH